MASGGGGGEAVGEQKAPGGAGQGRQGTDAVSAMYDVSLTYDQDNREAQVCKCGAVADLRDEALTPSLLDLMCPVVLLA